MEWASSVFYAAAQFQQTYCHAAGTGAIRHRYEDLQRRLEWHRCTWLQTAQKAV